ncbi:MAG: histidine phosphatase family protein [Candidatus Omnitrophica bacterium]|nr:histidine phosphatase family protein [Candidatus Omnitrophota bacterium]
MSTRVILVRHGETDWTRQRRYAGFTDIDLNETGRWQAGRLCERLHAEHIDKAYSSDLKRAYTSAKIALPDLLIEKVAGLREIKFGLFEGLTYQEAMEKHPEIYTRWIDNPRDVLIPQSEGLKKLAERVRVAIKEIVSSNKNKTVAIFTHGGPIRVILSDVAGFGLNDIWKTVQDLTGVNIIEFHDGEAQIQIQNDISHLKE